jgi:DNA-binding NtrC family response regulator
VTARVLIVDDEPALRRTLERALRNHKYEAVSVADPHSAYQMLEDSTFDVVLLDLRLPHLSGDTLYLAMVRRWPRLAGRVILMSGDPWSDQAERPPELATCPILAKPFSLDTLVKTVGDIISAADRAPDRLEGNGHG